ncbi:hypothetical protein B7R54_10825 [Subtercola boreus]|uniref:HTH araC/xylS-type domain-containing protein n=1 Tax=Subtercola boreus TaxID=120213 RepID=A0A3E0VI79_9MICO|nr:helix-turn-helix domain-containing protein [Subtercola boreus]RFA09656.1 hypothetical protein B7R54_10825 [Subtercola boreus]TQL53261.1 helix-turn-helix protein [Subtercola boreus]
MSEPAFRDPKPARWTLDGRDGLRALGPHLVAENPDDFHSRGRRWSLSGVVISDIAQTPVQISPSGRDPEQRDYVSIVFVRHGIFDLFGSDRTYRFEAGQAGYMVGWDEVEAVNPVKSRVAMVSLHRDLLAANGVTVTQKIGAFGDNSRLRRPTLGFLLALMEDLGASDDQTAPSGPASTMLTQLMAGLFLEDTVHRTESERSADGLRARAEAIIARSANDPDFSPQVLAERLNVSLRHLQRIFRSQGLGPAESIRAKRLETALAALRLASQAPRSVAEIAQQAGFSSVKELRYALRSSYGITPRELLAGRPLGEGSESASGLSLTG